MKWDYYPPVSSPTLSYAIKFPGVNLIVRPHMRVKNTGKEYLSNWIHMYTLDNGRVTMFEEFIDTAALVCAFSADE